VPKATEENSQTSPAPLETPGSCVGQAGRLRRASRENSSRRNLPEGGRRKNNRELTRIDTNKPKGKKANRSLVTFVILVRKAIGIQYINIIRVD